MVVPVLGLFVFWLSVLATVDTPPLLPPQALNTTTKLVRLMECKAYFKYFFMIELLGLNCEFKKEGPALWVPFRFFLCEFGWSAYLIRLAIGAIGNQTSSINKLLPSDFVARAIYL